MKKLLLFLAMAILLISSVSAEVNISVTDIGPTYIEWTWNNGLNETSVSIDGWIVYAFDHSSDQFLLSDINPNETHTIIVSTSTDIGSNTTTTPGQLSNSEEFYSILNTWIYLVFILLFIIVGMQRRLGIFLVVASILSLYALIVVIQSNTPGADPLMELPFYVYIAFFIFPHYLAFRKGGYTK